MRGTEPAGYDSGYAMDALTQDTRAAYALGYDSLGAYYRKIGVTDE